MKWHVPETTEEWFATIGASVFALVAIASYAQGGLVPALIAALIGCAIGAICGMIAHWAIFILPRDVSRFLEETAKSFFEFVKGGWIIISVILIGLIIFVGAQ